MTNLYQEVPTNSGSGVYNIKTPDVNVIDNNVKKPIAKDINDLIQYMETLVFGKSKKKHLESYSSPNSASKQITMKTIEGDNENSSETHYFPLVDINSIHRENFQNNGEDFILPEDPLAQLYFASLGLLGLFIFYRLMEKSK
jgi:hypothetical protein